MLIYDSDTRGRERDGSSQGALLATNRAQKAPATRKEAPADACVAFGRKISATWPDWALDFSQRPLKAQLVYCIAQRPTNVALRGIAARGIAWPARRKTAAIFARAAAHTAKRQLLAEGVAAAMRRRRARASHIARDHRASETTHKKRPPTRVTQTSPRALQPTHTPKRAGPLPHEAGHHVQAATIAPHPTPRAGVPRYSLRSSAKTRTTVIRAAGSV